MTDLWNSFLELGNLWYWAVGLIVIFPIIMLILNEVGYFAGNRDTRLIKPIKTVKSFIIPLIALVILLVQVLDFDRASVTIKVLQTLIWVLVINVGLDLITNLFFSGKKDGSGKVPQLFLDIFRVFLVLLGGAIVLSYVWDVELGGLITALGLGSFVLGLALQDTLGNLFSGISLVYEKPFEVGDYIKVEEERGRVVEMNWRAVHILTREEELIVIPHQKVAQNVIMNFSKPNRTFIIRAEVRFSYQDPPNRVKEALMETCLGTPDILHDPAPEIKTIDYSPSGIVYEIEFAIDGFRYHEEITDDLMSRVWYTAQRYQLTIPYPQLTLHQADNKPSVAQQHDEMLADTINELPNYFPIEKEKSQDLMDGSKILYFGKNETILNQGDPTGSLYVILEGEVILSAKGEAGKDVIINTIHKGDFFGEVALLSSRTSSMTARAKSDIKVMLIMPSEVMEMVSKNPKMAFQMDEVMDNRRSSLEKQLEDS
ncbi:mechanosensitive ion channel domain-containing protein [Maribacter sp. 2308TA10-17]|uniref:mechanosensitive ion channel domain-containing protein n=1 Tax=Maribacter sp. 2308TA10-17 TaxID=3386276 RepID=UPI0039BD7121